MPAAPGAADAAGARPVVAVAAAGPARDRALPAADVENRRADAVGTVRLRTRR